MVKIKAIIMKKRAGLGFTIIELVVVMGVIAILSTLVLTNYRSGQKRYALSQASQRLISDLRRAQNQAMGGIGVHGQYCGYGVHKSDTMTGSYIFFGDGSAVCPGNKQYDGGNELVEEIKLPIGITLSLLSGSEIDAFFLPPRPQTFITKDGMAATEVFFVLEATGTSLPTKTIHVTSAGLIELN